MRKPFIDELAGHLLVEGPGRYWRWDPDAVRSFMEGPVGALSAALEAGGEPDGEIHRADVGRFARLGCEGLGRGLMSVPSSDQGAAVIASSFLTICWWYILPRTLSSVPPVDRSERLMQLWNLGEALAEAPPWTNWIMCRVAATWSNLDDLEGKIADAFRAFQTPPTCARFTDRTDLSVLDGRARDPEFVPGELHAPAPRVVCVHDRCRASAHLTVVLDATGGNQLIGPSACFPGTGGAGPECAFSDRRFLVGERSIAVPGLTRCWRAVSTTAGYVVATIPDSQRIWVVMCG